ncbi:riboflavin kinase / FMN adenylyltransferase [Reichenbachiella agariperforans]|uniref:Riboflavin biosynthesis protein n=1 Tax=Reichenbachiella agariperforans TaxID=156994 RepID=A0A1M6N5M1_REIAG|nr:bifunctional riboflavin kinase/FAD synthetase [Reichenbachiella agariperforans]SHJ90942.1 riboflavin kinase / FMN adenylyltransferase [Reichenbachiella agariperforans]
MIVLDGIDQIHNIPHAIVTSGTFDGVHIGHQKILKKIVKAAQKAGGKSVVLTFWPHPRFVLFPDDTSLKLLTTFEEKAAILEEVGIDYLVKIAFTPAFSQLSSQEFIQDVLVDRIGTRKLIIGYDHKFGKNREGSFEYLKEHSQLFNFDVEEIPRQDIDDVGVSSTKIRKALLEGNVHLAHEYMGRPYEITGTVVSGKKIGSEIGFPTANIRLGAHYKVIPKDGVYAIKVRLDGQEKDAMLNIGFRPTVEGVHRVIEAHIFDFQQDIYDQEITVSFIQYMRGEQKFDSLTRLQEQLKIDKKESLAVLR